MPSDWYQTTAQQIEELKQKLLPREVKEYQLDKLQRLARRMAEFAPDDPVCQRYQDDISRMVTELAGAPLPHDRNKVYLCTIGDMVGHLKKAHKLVNEGEHLGLWLAVGLVLGGISGLFTGNTPLATALGLFAGMAIGLLLDSQAKKNGRVI